MARQPDVQYIRFYTQGSAAQKVKPVQEFQNVELPRPRRKKRIVVRVDPVAIVGCAVAVILLGMMVSGIFRVRQAQAQAAQMESYVAQLQAENEALAAQYAAGFDLEAVEQMALALGMVPKEQVEQVSISVSVPQEVVEEPGLWERIYTFLTGLLA